MRRPRSARTGFTLVELMIAVAIIGLLSAIAIPRFQAYVLRAKQTEALTMLAMAKNAEFAHFALNDCFLNIEVTPTTGAPSVIRQLWNSAPSGNANRGCADPSDRSFADVTVSPNQPLVYYEYECRRRLATAGTTDEFECSAHGDLDGDALFFEMIYGTDFDGDGQTIASIRGTVSFFPNDPVRISPGIF